MSKGFVVALAVGMAMTAGAQAANCGGRLQWANCHGILYDAGGGVPELDPDEGGYLCGSGIGLTPDAVRKVLKGCVIGQYCRIKGCVSWHGLGNWITIQSAQPATMWK